MENEKYCFLPVDELRKDIKLKYIHVHRRRSPSNWIIYFSKHSLRCCFFSSLSGLLLSKQQHRYFAKICVCAMCLEKQWHNNYAKRYWTRCCVRPSRPVLFYLCSVMHTVQHLCPATLELFLKIETQTLCFVRCWEGKYCVRWRVPVLVAISMCIEDYGMA